MSYRRELTVIERAVREGGQKALAMRSSIKAADIISKGGDPRDVLTNADPAVQEVMFKKLSRAFPGAVLIGEEGQTRAELMKLSAGGEEKVFVDPIDGTTNYTRPASFKWGTTAALLRDNEIIAGAICLPAVKVMITAAKGEGCYLNGKRQTISGNVPLAEAVLGVEWYFLDDARERKQLALIRAARGSHANLSAAYSIFELVRGEIDVYLNIHIPDRSACVWDFAAGHLFLQEMVAPEDRDKVAFFPDGTPLSYESRISMEALLTPYPQLAEQIVSHLRLAA